MAMHEIQLHGQINTPVSYFGTSVPQPQAGKVVVYRGEGLRHFLHKNGADPQGMRQFLLVNKIGRPFDMEIGVQMQIPAANTFKRHADSV